MEYVCLISQIIFILGTIFSRTNDKYLVNYNEYYKKYLLSELITQGLCIIINFVLIFVIKEFMIYILTIHVIFMAMILVFYSRKAKKRYFDELLNIIVANDLQSIDSKKIKKILLEKFEKVYFVEDIEKCKKHIKKFN